MTNTTPGELHALVGPLLDVKPEDIEGCIVIIALRREGCNHPIGEDLPVACLRMGTITDQGSNVEGTAFILLETLKAFAGGRMEEFPQYGSNGPSKFS